MVEGQVINVLGIDPGSKNFGYGVVSLRIKDGKVQYKVRECGILKHTITSLVNVNDAVIDPFLAEIESIVDRHNVAFITAERFQNRGGPSSRGDLIEKISFMLGLVASLYPVKLITAAQWKNIANRYVDLKKLYKNREIFKSEAHDLDSCLQAYYGGSLALGIKAPDLFKEIDWVTMASCVDRTTTNDDSKRRIEKAAIKANKPKITKPKIVKRRRQNKNGVSNEHTPASSMPD